MVFGVVVKTKRIERGDRNGVDKACDS